MPLSSYNLPEELTRATYQRVAVDTSVVLKIKYIGSQVAAHVTIAATTGDMTFEQGASTAAAAVGTGSNPGTAGVIDISTLSTVHELIRVINLADDWEAWAVDYLPDSDIEVSAGNAIFKTNLTDQDCTVAAGFSVVDDTSLETAEIFPVGVTLNGPSSNIHNSDRMTYHEILQINATVTFGGASGGINVYEVDDRAGTKTLIQNLPLTSNTATEWINASGRPLYSANNKRFVFQAVDASGAITSPSLSIVATSKVTGVTANPKRDVSRK